MPISCPSCAEIAAGQLKSPAQALPCFRYNSDIALLLQGAYAPGPFWTADFVFSMRLHVAIDDSLHVSTHSKPLKTDHVLDDTARKPPSKRLFIDPTVVASTNAVLTMGRAVKHPTPLLVEDRPWEHTFLNMFPSIWLDPANSVYKMWYWAAVHCSGKLCRRNPPGCTTWPCSNPPASQPGTCKCEIADTGHYNPYTAGILYAESRDGLTWTKPSLNLTMLDNSTNNNVVLAGGQYVVDGFSVLLDERDVPSRKWKLCSFAARGQMLAVSADGLHWNNWTEIPKGNDGSSANGRWDTYPSSHWDESKQQFVIFDRLPPSITKLRTEAYIHSLTDDWLGKWSETQGLCGDAACGLRLNSSKTRQPVSIRHSICVSISVKIE